MPNKHYSLIEFSVENFKIFKEKVTFSMHTRKPETNARKHAFVVNDEHVLKTSIIFGPNASGKSILLEAIDIMRGLVLGLGYHGRDGFLNMQSLPYYPFKLSDTSAKDPVTLSVVFSVGVGDDVKIYRYTISYLEKRILSEEAVLLGEKDIVLFSRVDEKVDFSDDKKKDILNEMWDTAAERNVTPYLRIAKAIKGENNDIYKFFQSGYAVLSGVRGDMFLDYSIERMRTDEIFRKKLLTYIKEADFFLEDVKFEENESSVFSFIHRFLNKAGKEIDVLFGRQEESVGTVRFLSLLGPIIDTLNKGEIILIDEFDNSLHPLLTQFIVNMFISKKHNPNNAQLIVTAHDTSLLDVDEYIRDQFWFTDKKRSGDAKLFSLAEFKDERNESRYSRKYLTGRFGAVPSILYR